VKRLAAILVACLAACEGDFVDPFKGDDNYITSFALTLVDGDTRPGVFEGDTIFLPATADVALHGADAIVATSENATIIPDPATIDAWDEEQLLVVTAYSGARRVYRYIPRYSNISREGDITLSTQEEVDAFPSLGITAIKGSLTIGTIAGTDSIISLDALASLREVVYDITVNPTFTGVILTLENLERAGSIAINASRAEVQEAYFPRLNKVNVSLNARDLRRLECPELTEVGKDCYLSAHADGGVLNVPGITRVGGTFTYSSAGTYITTLAFPRLEEAGALALTVNTGKLHAPELRACNGNITLGVPGGGSIIAVDMPRLEKTGGISLSNTKTLFLRLPALADGGNITLNTLPLETLDLPALETATQLQLQGLAKLHELDIRSARITTRLYVYNTDSILVKGNGAYCEAIAVSGTSRVFRATGIPEVGTLTPPTLAMARVELTGTTRVKNALALYANVHLSCPDLEELGGTFTYRTGNYALGELDLGKLRTIAGSLVITTSGTSLVNLDAFASLTSVGSVDTRNQQGLVSFEGLKNAVGSLDASKWTVSGNAYKPTFQDMLDGKYTNL
jgi:hypothetical protein